MEEGSARERPQVSRGSRHQSEHTHSKRPSCLMSTVGKSSSTCSSRSRLFLPQPFFSASARSSPRQMMEVKTIVSLSPRLNIFRARIAHGASRTKPSNVPVSSRYRRFIEWINRAEPGVHRWARCLATLPREEWDRWIEPGVFAEPEQGPALPHLLPMGSVRTRCPLQHFHSSDAPRSIAPVR